MHRRKFIALFGSAMFACPLAGRSQPARKFARIGVLVGGSTADMMGPEPKNPYIGALIRGLRERGWVYARDFVTEPRGGEGVPERFPGLVAEIVALQPDVIVAPGPMLPYLKRATATIPIVMAASGDPVGEGYIRSLAQPGGNFTGLSLQSVEITGKLLELLKELVPGKGLVGVLWDQASLPSWQAAEAAAQARGWKLLSLEIRHPDEIEAAFKTATNAGADALLVVAGSHLFGRRQHVVELAARSRLPAMYALRPYVDSGGLISYSASLVEIWRRASVYVDKILKGEKPADLPIEQPTKFELVINLKAAKALGLTIPPTLLVFADEVIE